MADSYVVYEGDGSTAQFAVPFSFLDRDYVVVTVDGVEATPTWINDGLLQITAPDDGALVRIERQTPTTALVDFANGAVLTEDDLDTMVTQLIHIAQEAKDKSNDAITLDSDGEWDADNKNIKNVAAPTADSHAVNKAYGDANYGGTAASNAAASASAANTAKLAAQAAQANAEAAAVQASAILETVRWRDVVYVSGPATVAPTVDNGGTLYVCDTSSGAITVNLPSIAGLSLDDGEAWSVTFKKNTSDANAVTINRNGTDTIDGGTAALVLDEYLASAALIADTSPSPDDWGVLHEGFTVPDESITLAKLVSAAKTYDIPFVAGWDADWNEESIEVKTYQKIVLARDVTLEAVVGSIETAPDGDDLILDIEVNGVSIFSSTPQFADGSSTLSAGTISTTTADAGDVITFKVTQIGSSTAGSGVLLTLKARLR
jgi:hypothetical protein